MPKSEIKNDLSNAKVIDYGEILASWKFPEFDDVKRGKNWYIIGAIVVILLIIWAAYDRNPIFIGIIILSAAWIVYMNTRKPELVEVFITDRGVMVGSTYRPYKEFENFAIVYDPPQVKKLYIEPRSNFKPRFTILLEDINPLKIREILLKFLDEDLEREEESSSEALTRMFKL